MGFSCFTEDQRPYIMSNQALGAFQGILLWNSSWSCHPDFRSSSLGASQSLPKLFRSFQLIYCFVHSHLKLICYLLDDSCCFDCSDWSCILTEKRYSGYLELLGYSISAQDLWLSYLMAVGNIRPFSLCPEAWGFRCS